MGARRHWAAAEVRGAGVGCAVLGGSLEKKNETERHHTMTITITFCNNSTINVTSTITNAYRHARKAPACAPRAYTPSLEVWRYLMCQIV